jgi:hypothetical protein
MQEEGGSYPACHDIFFSAIIPRNIPKYISKKLFQNFSSYITSGHLHSDVYLGKSADFYDSECTATSPRNISSNGATTTLKLL